MSCKKTPSNQSESLLAYGGIALTHTVRTSCADPGNRSVLAAPRFVLAAQKFVLAAPRNFWMPCGTRAAEQFRFTYMYYMYLHKKQGDSAEALPPLECA
jgi:hypothetical protein